MYIQVKIKCDRNNTPYRVFINGELMTERFYTAPKNWDSNDRISHTCNTLALEIADAEHYTAKITDVPGTEKARVWIEDVKWQSTSVNPSVWDQIDDPVAAGLKGDALNAYREKYGTK